MLKVVSLLCGFIYLSNQAVANNINYKLYVDADFSNTPQSSQAISQGIKTALVDANLRQNVSFEVEHKDHKGVARLSHLNMLEYNKTPSVLAVFTGLHSVPVLKAKHLINQSKILTLDPWAAAGPITRPETSDNWIFRLSIDDTNAGTFISDSSTNEGFKKPHLLLERTLWGRSNQKTMTAALSKYNIKPQTSWFNLNLTLPQATRILKKIKSNGHDSIFLVANTPEGVTIAKAMANLPPTQRLPIRSHWGITGGNFTNQVPHSQRKKLDLTFIQTKFSMYQPQHEQRVKSLMTRIQQANPEIKNISDIPSQTGFIHAYDLTKLFLQAVNQCYITGDRKNDKQCIHSALENLTAPVHGLIKTYRQPFSVYTTDSPQAHEALRIEDYAMGYFAEDGLIRLID